MSLEKNIEPDIENLPAMFDEKVLAKVVGKSTYWCQRSRWEKKGPPYVKVGAGVRYQRKDFLGWLDENKVKG
jgi:hypothetical protein